MTESISGIDTDNRASWLDLPDPGFLESWKNRNESQDLMDGAYFGLSGDPIIDIREKRQNGFVGCIAAHNPGLGKISSRIPDIIVGRILAVLDNDGLPKDVISFPEAENEGWIREKRYLDAWGYLGKNSMNMWNRISTAHDLIPNTVYQVTKKGVSKITITERDIQRPNIFYFFGLRPRI